MCCPLNAASGFRLINIISLELLPYVLDEKDKYRLPKWLEECLNEYLRYASKIVDLEYRYFEYEDNKISQR